MTTKITQLSNDSKRTRKKKREKEKEKSKDVVIFSASLARKIDKSNESFNNLISPHTLINYTDTVLNAVKSRSCFTLSLFDLKDISFVRSDRTQRQSNFICSCRRAND